MLGWSSYGFYKMPAVCFMKRRGAGRAERRFFCEKPGADAALLEEKENLWVFLKVIGCC